MNVSLCATALSVLLVPLAPCSAAPQGNLVHNGSFEQEGDPKGTPEGWASAGADQVKQHLARVPEGKGFAARLECTEFQDGTAACHAMICQMGVVAVRRGTWYRLTFRARAEGIRGRVLQVALSNTRDWSNSGLSDAVTLGPAWRNYEVVFQASADVPAETSRLQFWYMSTGTLWLDDVSLVATEMKSQWQPQLPTEGRTNFLPNSSFECGAAGWGSFAPDLQFWHGNVYRQLGRVDDTTAAHGRCSLRLDFSEQSLPTYYFDWFDPVRRPVRSLVAAHHGWAPLRPGQGYVLSAFLKADRPGRAGILLVRQASGRTLRTDLRLSTDWQRCEFPFTAETEFAWVGAGGDLAASEAREMVVWVDAVQLQEGAQATDYQPWAPVEVWAEPEAPGGLFAAPVRGPSALHFRLRAFNNTAQVQRPRVTLSATDFLDAPALRRDFALDVPAHAGVTRQVALAAGKLGFYRVRLAEAGKEPCQEMRCTALRPHGAPDSRFGMNHAYPWGFLLDLAGRAGIRWWRDWTVQWRTIQPQREAALDFREPDIQIDRVLQARGNVLTLFPFPSAMWCSTASPDDVARLAQNEWERPQVQASFKPTDEKAFGEYVAASVRHYRGRTQVYQIFNEALYTSYALPAAGGHTIDDYVRLLRIAYRAIKAEQPDALVLAGPGIWADSHWAKDFVEAGGLQFADALDVHLYPRGDPEFYAESLARLWKRMKERGEAKPIWLTEVGCYADDDPATTPLKANFGDSAMRMALKDSEREASEWLVKFCTLFFANGGAKVFLHAGTCGEINGEDVGGVFFEYGGAPRKMLAAVATMAGLLPPEARFEKQQALGDQVTAYWFATPAGRVGVAWSMDGATHRLRLSSRVRRGGLPAPQVLDLMGNRLAGPAQVGDTPVYLVSRIRQAEGAR